MGRTIKVMDDNGTYYILVSIIMYALGTKNGSRVYCKGGKDYHCPLSVRNFILKYVGLGFHKIHKSTLININHVKKRTVFKVEIVTMFNKVKLVVSVRRQKDFVKLKIRSWLGLGQ